MSDEIENIKKRLQAVENDVKELREQNLFIARMISQALCTVTYNVNLHYFRGAELESYTKLWKKRIDDVLEEIVDSKTPKEAVEKCYKFYEEISEYIRAAKVDTAEKAMEIAHAFIKKYVPVALPLKAVKEKDVWLVDIDVGALSVKVAKVKVDARTGDVLSYDIPTKESRKTK
jgi:hypothetical protein